MPSWANAFCAINPNDIDRPWNNLPGISYINKKLFENASPQVVQDDFRVWGETLNGIASGWRLKEGQLSKEQSELAKQLTIIAHEKGVGFDWVDSNGCRALSHAVSVHDVETARFLAKIGGDIIGQANPDSKVSVCRVNAYVLAVQRGIDLNRETTD